MTCTDGCAYRQTPERCPLHAAGTDAGLAPVADLGARVAEAITFNLGAYTLPANYSTPIDGRENHWDVAKRCGLLIAEEVIALLNDESPVCSHDPQCTPPRDEAGLGELVERLHDLMDEYDHGLTCASFYNNAPCDCWKAAAIRLLDPETEGGAS